MSSDKSATRSGSSGQALVEFTLVAPLLFTMFLGMVGIFYLDLSAHRMQNGIDVLAELAALAPGDSWKAKVSSENERTGCHADPLMPEVDYPDGGAAPGNRILLTWRCHLNTDRWLFHGLPVTVSAEAVIAARRESPTLAPSPSPSP